MIGKTNQEFVKMGIEEFRNRLKHYVPFETEIIPEIKNTKHISREIQKEKEGELILKNMQQGDCLVLLDEKGLQFTSVQFADYIQRKTYTVNKKLVFVIGGPYGFSPEVYDAAFEKISLSRMTFSHQMIRLIFVEQLYRAMTILNNEPYHHE